MIPQFHFAPEEMQAYVSKVFGAGYLVAGIARMHGGAQKAVYKVECQNGFSCVLYVWDLSQNYFQEEILNESGADRSYGSDLFALNNRYLRQHGISTPRLYDLNNDRDRIPFDFALVEYVQGQKAEAYFQLKDTEVREALFRRVGDMVAAMHAMERSRYGKADQVGGNDRPCFEAQREHAESALTYAAGHLANVRENDSGLLDKLHGLASEIQPRRQYRFIHGELGPDHILIDDQMQPFLIDIEGAEFYDLEHEHSFLQLRFGDFYRFLKRDDLDPARMRFYRYCHHLSLTAGGLKLLHRKFPDQKFAKDLAAYHARCAIEIAAGKTH